MGIIYIKAEQIEDCGGGLFAIQIPTRILTDDERNVISELFPNLADKVYEVLEKEALVSAIADPALPVPSKTKGKVKKQSRVEYVPPRPSYDCMIDETNTSHPNDGR